MSARRGHGSATLADAKRAAQQLRRGHEVEPAASERILAMTAPATERVRVISPGRTYFGRQGLTYGAGASAETVGAERICMNVLPMPDGARAKVHYHRGIETIAYILDGECAVYYGAHLERRAAVRAGEQVFIPADVPHAPCNDSGAPCTWIVVHAAGSDQEGIVLLPELDALLASR